MRLFLVFILFISMASSPLCRAEEMTFEDAVNALEKDYNYSQKTWFFIGSTALFKIVWYENSAENYFTVTFMSNVTKPYLFKGMTTMMWIDWSMAKSPGGYYNENIRGQPLYLVNVWNPRKKY